MIPPQTIKNICIILAIESQNATEKKNKSIKKTILKILELKIILEMESKMVFFFDFIK